MIDYLKNEMFRNRYAELKNFDFDREVPEDSSIGRIDIKIKTINTFKNQKNYFIIECKRLDSKKLKGVSGLNAKYIKLGILRFIEDSENFYQSYNKINGMIGFIVESIDIDDNIQNINNLIKNNFTETNTHQLLQKENFIPNFNYHYSSKHKENKNNQEITLYHLMFDFSNNII